MLDLVGALEGAVDPAAELGPGIGGVERLIRIHGAGGVGVGGDLPAGEVDRLQAGADHLHRLVAGDGAQRIHIILAVEELPEPLGAAAGEAVLDRDRAAQPLDLGDGIGPVDAVEAARRGGDDGVEVGHGALKVDKFDTQEALDGRDGQLAKGSRCRSMTCDFCKFLTM